MNVHYSEENQIGFTSSDSFLKPTLVMLTSFFINNSKKYTFNFLFTNTSKSTREKFKEIIEKNKCHYVEWKLDESLFNGFALLKRYNYTSYFRICLPFLVSNNCRKILWIDSDTVINGSIDDLFYIKKSFCLNGVSYPEVECKNKLGLSNQDEYINCGVILYDVNLIKNKFSLKQALVFFVKNQSKFTYIDQCFLNLFYRNSIGCFSSKYNDVIYRIKKYSKKQVKEKIDDDIVIHFVGNIKPWNYFYDSNMYKAYWKYGRCVFGSFYYYKWLFVSRIFFIFRPFMKIFKKMRKKNI
jgi:lipopolysaccharide biosynthesis glycosyltransferase